MTFFPFYLFAPSAPNAAPVLADEGYVARRARAEREMQVAEPSDAEDFPGSVMTPAPAGCPSLGGSLGLVPTPRVSLHPDGNFVVIRGRVDDVLEVRFVPPAFIVEEAPTGSHVRDMIGFVLDGNGMRTDRFPHAADSLIRRHGVTSKLASFDRKREVARFHTFENAARALDAAQQAWEASSRSPKSQVVAEAAERVAKARADLAEAHRQADAVRDALTAPIVDKMAVVISERQEAALAHVASRDAEVKAAMRWVA